MELIVLNRLTNGTMLQCVLQEITYCLMKTWLPFTGAYLVQSIHYHL